MNFYKYSANGNDFILIHDPPLVPGGPTIQRLCDRHFGIGADGLLILSSQAHSHRMRIFNSDGNEADMCANGLRAAFTFLQEKGRELSLKTQNGSYTAEFVDGAVRVEMTEIRDANSIQINAPDFLRSFYVSTGVPHIVLLSERIEIENFQDAVLPFRHYPGLPNGANVNLVEIVPGRENVARVRTFERGVEGETLSCGTGLTASALALRHWFGWSGKIHLKTKGGDHTVELGEKVFYTGEVTLSFTGEVDLE